MRAFLETSFGPNELSVIDQSFKDWLETHHVTKNSAEAELAAAIIINLYREGHDTRQELDTAMSLHRGLADLGELASRS
ncbi:hypothetical protein J2T08_001670 [Neorhizobium galegae]|jgi:hypothetical protein|uniref:hypothetical protein n=1 Tax=Rhizobium/Agrobacterium group TaxID=227290 RepID=UPI000DD895C4|nr:MULTISPECIES: hypothetical protein [Rhizobium/Agrobacterium group]MBP2562262.1 hypothetical protein [Neorhizobium galegae]MDQ0133752.1 hypothetical protein [Neorhizobium galegae]TCR78631.1 hypothetical protein EV561_1174 [Rhizobium sp. BK376]